LKESKQLFKNYAYEDGFSGIEVNFGKTIYEDKDGTIWIGADGRLTAFHPARNLRILYYLTYNLQPLHFLMKT
jgi:hypothetical protein